MALSFFDRSFGGTKGGKSTSPAKVAAAKRNGRNNKAGRPLEVKVRTLGEYILRQRLTRAQHDQIDEAWIKLDSRGGIHSERFIFKKLFGWNEYGDRTVRENQNPLTTHRYNQPRRKLTDAQQLVLKQVRTVARHYLKK
jgi:hypothetical protein